MPNNDLISRKQAIHFLKTLAYDKDMSDEGATAVCMAWGGIDRMPAVDAEPVRHGRCRMCNIKETGHGVIACYDVGWEVCINRSGLNYYMAVNHDGSQINFQIDFCPYCGAKMDKEEKREHWKDREAVREVGLPLHHGQPGEGRTVDQ